MGKKQTRRTVSITGRSYAKLRTYAEQKGQSMSDVVEKAIAPLLVGVVEHYSAASPAPAQPSRVNQIRAAAEKRGA